MGRATHRVGDRTARRAAGGARDLRVVIDRDDVIDPERFRLLELSRTNTRDDASSAALEAPYGSPADRANGTRHEDGLVRPCSGCAERRFRQLVAGQKRERESSGASMTESAGGIPGP